MLNKILWWLFRPSGYTPEYGIDSPVPPQGGSGLYQPPSQAVKEPLNSEPVTIQFHPAGQRCPLCGGAGEYCGTRDGYALRECRGALEAHAPVLLSWQWSSVAEYEALYTEPQRYHVAMQQSEHQPLSWARDGEHLVAAHARLQFLQAMKPGGTLLDIGAGTGAFVAMAQAYGYEAAGVEPTELAEAARRIGRNVEYGVLQNLTVRNRADIFTLHDVWEHLTDPYCCLLHLRHLLNPGGLIVVEIPEWDCPQAREAGVLWKHVRPLQHLFLPSDGAAQALFAMAGLRVEALVRPKRGQIGKITYYLSERQLHPQDKISK